jgi:beta-glucosidase
MITRRELIGTGAAVAGSILLAQRSNAAIGPASEGFPKDFLWGASTSGYQIEGNATASDIWLLEQVKPSLYHESSGDACDFLHRWASDLDLLKQLGLNSFRLSFEWSRIEPEPGQFSAVYLDHYRRIVDGCLERGIIPVTTFNHFAAPRWFSAQNGWLHGDSANLFARYCDKVSAHMGDRLRYAVTINEPNIEHLLSWSNLPPEVVPLKRAMRLAAAKAAGTEQFSAFTSILPEELDRFRDNLLAAHTAARAAIRSRDSTVKIGVSIALSDDQVISDVSLRDQKRREVYEPWLEIAKSDDFIGIQNYDRSVFGSAGLLPPPEGATLNQLGAEVYPASLANVVRYAHMSTGRPVLITEHGVATTDDTVRSRFIEEALRDLQRTTVEGVPVLGYMHWSLLDNFEWIFGYRPTFGLIAVDRKTQTRTPKPSARVLGQIARLNRV